MIRWEELTQAGQEEVIRLTCKESFIPDCVSVKEHFLKWMKK